MKHNRVLSLILCVVLVALMVVPCLGTVTVSAAATDTVVYLASYGSDDNDGSESAPFATLQKAWTNSNTGNHTIIVVDTVALDSTSFIWGSENKAAHTTIKGASADSVLDISIKTRNGLYCSGGLTFEDITLKFDSAKTDGVPNSKFYCNGNHVVIAETVKFADNTPIQIFAGGNNKTTGSTNLEVYGGYYYYIYGGGEGSGSPVNGDVNLTIGGNVNAGENIDDNSSNVAQARIYGGGYQAGVTGDVNINYGGDAISRVLTGTGRNGGEIGGSININMTGGKVTTISGTKTVNDADAKVFITVTGGLCEAIFGGGESTSLNGDVQIYLGANAEVSRRVFGGCYNDTNWLGTSFNSSNHVIGTVTVIVEPGAKIGTGTGLSSGNKIDMGLYTCSRYNSGFADEICTLVLLDGATVSKLGGSYSDYTDYKVNVAAGGTVESAMNGTAALKAVPDSGKVAVVDGALYAAGEVITLNGNTNVTFAEAYTVTFDVTGAEGENDTAVALAGDSVTVVGTTATKTGYGFLGWATNATATEPEYVAGDSFVPTADTVLYAVWRKTASYTVIHYLETANGGVSVYKVETKTGMVGFDTEAEAGSPVGYTVANIGKEVIEENEMLLVAVYYQKLDTVIYDVNCDGSVDMLDLMLLERKLASWDGYDADKVCDYNADANADGKVDIDDAVMMERYLAGYENP